MAKAIFAVTNIKSGSLFVPAGSTLNRSDFSDDQLVELLDAGAIEVRVVEEPVVEAPEAPETTEPPVDNTQNPEVVQD